MDDRAFFRIAERAGEYCATGILDRPVLTDTRGPPHLDLSRDPLVPDARVGCYEVLALISAGGLGEVYRARDVRLKRSGAQGLAGRLCRRPGAQGPLPQ